MDIRPHRTIKRNRGSLVLKRSNGVGGLLKIENRRFSGMCMAGGEPGTAAARREWLRPPGLQHDRVGQRRLQRDRACITEVRNDSSALHSDTRRPKTQAQPNERTRPRCAVIDSILDERLTRRSSYDLKRIARRTEEAK